MSSHNYTRRDFIKAMGLGAAALAAPGCTGSPQLRARNSR
ncbi:MAG: twin-arginine translocation signal domain-containing protein, partial [Planctomycetota bacterium]